MIVYQPNKNWLRDIGHLSRSWTMQKIMRSVIGVGIGSAIICYVLIDLYPLDLMLDTGVFSLLGVVLSILLVFRTNSAYDRWWEGRKQWGALVNHCRTLAIQVNGMFPEDDKATRKFIAIRISNFCIALKEHLREGVKFDELISVTDEELEEYQSVEHVPNKINSEIFNKLQNAFRAGVLTPEDMLNLKPQTQALIDILGACERIKKTPIPFSYSVYLKIFITAYTAMLPFGLISDFGYYTIPLTMFIFFAMIGVEMMGEEIEDPFGLDCNDLPTGTISHTIKDNVFEILMSRSSLHHEHKRELYDKIF